MKRICVSQRVDIATGYGERRDALDQRWVPFLKETGVVPFPLPNEPGLIPHMLKILEPDGVLLTGGNSPVRYGGDSLERDAVDELLLDYATAHEVPLIGVCRGMQSVLLYFGGSLKQVDGHVAVNHKITGRINREVNSYHELTADIVPPCLEVVAFSEDALTEALKHSFLPIVAIMWHPERGTKYDINDICLFSQIWQGRVCDI